MKPTTYKERRTTLTLAAASAYFRNCAEPRVAEAMARVREANYDLERCDDETLELLFGYLDDGVMRIIRDEYVFRPTLGSVRDHKAHVAHCELCGKGDSREDGGNEDKLRYDFALTNEQTGGVLYCGSTCIINYGLKVVGATTAEEARQILMRSMREHLQMWREEAWRTEHPAHEEIPSLHKKLIEVQRDLRSVWWSGRMRMIVQCLDGDKSMYANARITALGCAITDFRSALKFYLRRKWLTETKHATWIAAQKTYDDAMWLYSLYQRAQVTDLEGVAAFVQQEKALRYPPPRRRPTAVFGDTINQ